MSQNGFFSKAVQLNALVKAEYLLAEEFGISPTIGLSSLDLLADRNG